MASSENEVRDVLRYMLRDIEAQAIDVVYNAPRNQYLIMVTTSAGFNLNHVISRDMMELVRGNDVDRHDTLLAGIANAIRALYNDRTTGAVRGILRDAGTNAMRDFITTIDPMTVRYGLTDDRASFTPTPRGNPLELRLQDANKELRKAHDTITTLRARIAELERSIKALQDVGPRTNRIVRGRRLDGS